MESDFSSLSRATHLQLALGRPITLTDVREISRVEVTRGTVWLTQSGRNDDVFLMQGDSIAPNKLSGDVVIECLSAHASVCVIAPRRDVQRIFQLTRVARGVLQFRHGVARVLRSLACKLDPQTC